MLAIVTASANSHSKYFLAFSFKDRMKVLRAGFQIHLPKPVEPAELIAVVANLGGRHQT
jgi:CheY-like chemotaxis protein